MFTTAEEQERLLEKVCVGECQGQSQVICKPIGIQFCRKLEIWHEQNKQRRGKPLHDHWSEGRLASVFIDLLLLF